MPEHHFDSACALDKALSDTVVSKLAQTLDSRAHASLVVSGGSTPKGLFALLSEATLDWARVTVVLADERWVEADHDDANRRMVRESLLRGTASEATFISLADAYPDTHAALHDVERALADIDQFDVVILGMGLDGHTASLFPCSLELQEGLTTAAAALVTQPTTAPHKRISLSRKRLLATHYGALHIVGNEKKKVLVDAQKLGLQTIKPAAGFIEPDGPFELWFAP